MTQQDLSSMTESLRASFNKIMDKANGNLSIPSGEYAISAAELFKAATMIVQTVANIENGVHADDVAGGMKGLEERMDLLAEAVLELAAATPKAPRKTTPKAVPAAKT